MWVSSFVIALPEGSERVARILKALDSVPVFETGEIVGSQLPVVLEVEDGSNARYWHHWVEELPGVVHVDVAFVSFDDGEPPAETTAGVEETEDITETK